MEETRIARQLQLDRVARTLPGSRPYCNHRPINVPQRLDGATLLECLCAMVPSIDRHQWLDWFEQGHIVSGSLPVRPAMRVRGGQQLRHLFPDTVEPEVAASIKILWEDDALLAVSKPAPLPMHPCGRFNRNTLLSILGLVYTEDRLRPAHRLDANTTGVVLLNRSREAATAVQSQFERREVDKEYLVLAAGCPTWSRFTADAPITSRRQHAGARAVADEGPPAQTHFEVIERLSSGQCLLRAKPLTGRTNQIRIHLWDLGMPVVGDPLYLAGRQMGRSQTLAVEAPAMCLHAHRIQLLHPTAGRPLSLTAPKPHWLIELNR